MKHTSKQQVTPELMTLQVVLPSNHGRRVYYRCAYLAQAVLNWVDSSRHVPQAQEDAPVCAQAVRGAGPYEPPFKPVVMLGP